MKHTEFRIGIEFWCNGRRWRCTDVGTRVVAAISLEPLEVEEITSPDSRVGAPTRRRYTTDDPSWLTGPPYKVAEVLFDEYDLEACSLDPEDSAFDDRATG